MSEHTPKSTDRGGNHGSDYGEDHSGEMAGLRRAFTATYPDDVPRPDCPPAERIWAGVHDEMSPRELRELLHHVAACPVCTEAWRLGRAVEDEAKNAAEEDVEKDIEKNVNQDVSESKSERRKDVATSRRRGARPGGWRAWSSLAAAAAVVLTVGLAWRQPAPPTTNRGAGDTSIALENAAPMPRDAFELRWTGPEEAARYDLRVSTPDLLHVLVEETELEEARYLVPESRFDDVAPGTALMVHLEAFHPLSGSLGAVTSSVVVQ